MKDSGCVLLHAIGEERLTRGLGGRAGVRDPVPLNDGRFLRVSVSAYIDTDHEDYLKVRNSAYQYQHDVAGEEWVFRYDYLRHPHDPHPACHLQIRGKLQHPIEELQGIPLERIHFPTRRMSLEAAIRLLADQFRIECNTDSEIWRAVLTEGESRFRSIAHDPPSGPSA